MDLERLTTRLKHNDPNLEKRLKTLSKQERRIFRDILDGLSAKESAEHQSISSRTVEVHRGQILKKLGFRSVASLLARIVQAAFADQD